MIQAAYIQGTLIRSLGTTMIHFIWEGILISFLIWLLLIAAGRHRSFTRYIILYSGLVMMFVAFLITFRSVYMSFERVETSVATTMPMTAAAGIRFSSVNSTGLANMVMEGISMIPGYVHGFLTSLWFAGFLFLLLRLAGGYYNGHVITVKRSVSPGQDIVDMFKNVCIVMGLSQKLQIRVSVEKTVPMVAGIIKPVIIIPLAAINNLSIEQTETIIAHEIAHIKRLDNIFLLIEEFIKAMLFFHPVVWILTEAIDRERENCCDDLVTRRYSDSFTYIKALTMVQELDLEGYVPANAATRQPKLLLKRILRLTRPASGPSWLPLLSTVFFLVATAGIVIATTIKPGIGVIESLPEISSSGGQSFSLPVLSASSLLFPQDTPKIVRKETTDIYKFKGDSTDNIIIGSVTRGDSVTRYYIRSPYGMMLKDSVFSNNGKNFILGYPGLIDGKPLIFSDSMIILRSTPDRYGDTIMLSKKYSDRIRILSADSLYKNFLSHMEPGDQRFIFQGDSGVFFNYNKNIVINDSGVFLNNDKILNRDILGKQLQAAGEQIEIVLKNFEDQGVIISKKIEIETEDAVRDFEAQQEEMLKQLQQSEKQLEESVRQKQISEEQRIKALEELERARQQMENALRELELSGQQREKALRELEEAREKINDLTE